MRFNDLYTTLNEDTVFLLESQLHFDLKMSNFVP